MLAMTEAIRDLTQHVKNEKLALASRARASGAKAVTSPKAPAAKAFKSPKPAAAKPARKPRSKPA
jgi:hypothetical protein